MKRRTLTDILHLGRSGGVAVLIGLCAASLEAHAQAQPISPSLSHCAEYLMKTGAFYGSTQSITWQKPNAFWLCDGSTDNATPPQAVACFSGEMKKSGDWQKSVVTCRAQLGLQPGTPNAILADIERQAKELQQQQSGQKPAPTQQAQQLPAQPQPTQQLPNQQQAEQQPAKQLPTLQPIQKLAAPAMKPQQSMEQPQPRRPAAAQGIQSQPPQQPAPARPEPQPRKAAKQQQAAPEQVNITITNATSQPVQQILEGPNGATELYYTLKPNEVVDQASIPGYRWLFKSGGQDSGDYVTTADAEQNYTIRASTAAGSAPKSGSQQQAAGAPLNGLNVRTIDTGSVALVRLAGDYWGEVEKSTGVIKFAFKEAQRSATEVLLIDSLRGVQLRISVPDLQVYYGAGGPATQPFFKILGASAESRIPGSNIDYQYINPPAYTVHATTVAAPVPAPLPQQQSAAPLLSAKNVRMIDMGPIALVKLAGDYWGEVEKSTGSINFVFKEAQRTGTDVQLFDGTRRVQLRINIPDLQVYYGSDGAPATVPFYKILSGSPASRIPGLNVDYQNTNAPADKVAPKQETKAVLVPPVDPPATPPSPAAGRTGSDPAKAFDAGNYEKVSCKPQKATLGPGAATMTQILGVCGPVRTAAGEFANTYKSEELTTEMQFTKGGPRFRLVSNPSFQAWVDTQGDINIAINTNANSINIENAENTKLKRGPFFRSMTVTVTPSTGAAQVQSTFPENGMGSSNSSRSVGYTLNASIGVNVGSPLASGLNAGVSAGYSDTTTTSTQLQEYKVAVRTGSPSNQRIFDWYLCAWGPLSECYKGSNDLLTRAIFNSALVELIELPPAAFRISGFKSDIYYKITDIATKRALLSQMMSVSFNFRTVFNIVSPKSIDSGFRVTTNQNTPYSNRLNIYQIDLSELARIIFANPDRYGIN